LTTYFVLLNRVRLENEVEPMIARALAGRRDEAIHILKDQRSIVASKLDKSLQQTVDLALDTLEGRLSTAFVNELAPLITEPKQAFEHNVAIHVRAGLALSICSEEPGPGLSPALAFRGRFSALLRDWSPTVDDVSDHDDPLLVEPIRIGIFGEPEMLLRRVCSTRIAGEIRPRLDELPTLGEDEQTVRFVQHFDALINGPLRKTELTILRGYS
jgi:hypothetical protein